MNLVDDFMTECVLMEKHRTSDGEGGFVTEWVEGAEFSAAIIQDTSTLARIAEKQGVTNTYSVYTSKSISLEFPDVFKRLNDGETFRITESPSAAPSSAGLNLSKVGAERWVLT